MPTQPQLNETLIQDLWIDGLRYWKVGDTLIAPISGGETPPNPGEGDPPPSDDDPTTWDKDRAARTITAQRAREKALSDELKAAKTLSDEMSARVKAIEDKDKSAGEKALSDLDAVSKKLAAAEKAQADAEQRYQAAQILAAIDREAHKANAVDVDAVAALIDRSEITLADDGTVTGADKAVAALLKAKTYLVKAEGDATQTGVIGTGATPRTNGRPGPKDAEDAIYNRMREQSGTTRW